MAVWSCESVALPQVGAGYTALMKAAELGNVGMVQTLLEKGAAIDIQNQVKRQLGRHVSQMICACILLVPSSLSLIVCDGCVEL